MLYETRLSRLAHVRLKGITGNDRQECFLAHLSTSNAGWCVIVSAQPKTQHCSVPSQSTVSHLLHVLLALLDLVHALIILELGHIGSQI